MSTIPFEKTQQNLRVNVDIDAQLTWGELFQFVDMAHRAGVDPDEPVGLQYNEHDPSILDAMYVYVQQMAPDGGER